MTERRRDGGDTPFGAWIRSKSKLNSRHGYDVEDIDRIHTRQYIYHQYLRGQIMLLEEKQHNRSLTQPQRDTMSVLNQALKHGFSDPNFRCRRLFEGRPDKYTYFGYHHIRFENTSPTDGRIFIDDHFLVTEEELLCFMQFDERFITERLKCPPLMVDVMPQPKRKSLKKKDCLGIPTLFDSNPMQQYGLWGVQ